MGRVRAKRIGERRSELDEAVVTFVPPTLSVVITSNELGLAPGALEDLDAAIGKIGRERVALRIVAVLNTLALGKTVDARRLSEWYAKVLPPAAQLALRRALAQDDSLFLEPWQLLTVLKRALTVCPVDSEGLDFLTEAGETAFFDACRFAADLLLTTSGAEEGDPKKDPDAWVKVAAGLMPRIWMLNPPDPRFAVARFNVMFHDIPDADPQVAERVARLSERFPAAMDGLTFTEATTLTYFLAFWSIRLKPDDIFKDQAPLRLNPDTFLKDTKIGTEPFQRFLARTALDVKAGLADDGGRASPLVFRNRPLLEYSNGTVSPVFPPFLLEKLTQDIFWWLKDLDADQQQQWQADWGYVAEAHVLRILARAAELSGCQFVPRDETAEGEVDGVMWHKGHIAVIEITSSSLRDSEGATVDWKELRTGLRRAFVENPGGNRAPYKEAVLQLVRDVRLALGGRLGHDIPSSNIQRIYPVMVATDRRTRTPGVVRFLQREFTARLTAEELTRVAGLAVLGIEDVEGVEVLVQDRQELQRQTPRGPLKILRRWDVDRGEAPSWWHFIEWAYGSVRVNDELMAQAQKFRDSLPNYFTAAGQSSSPSDPTP